MSCPVTSYVPPTFDSSLASEIAGKVSASTKTISENVGEVTGAISGLESELEKFQFDTGFAFDTPGNAPQPPSIDSFDVMPATPIAVGAPTAGTLTKPGAPSVTVGDFTESSLTSPTAPSALATFSKPGAPSGFGSINVPSLPGFNGGNAPGFIAPGDVPAAIGTAPPDIPALNFEFGSLLNIVGYNAPAVPDLPDFQTDFLVSEALKEYGWMILGSVETFNNQWLTDASGFFLKMKNASAVGSRLDEVFQKASSIWSRAGVSDDKGASEYVAKAHSRYAEYLTVLESNFDLRTNIAAKAAALEKISAAVSVVAAYEMVKLDHKIALIEQKLDVAVAGIEKFVETRRAETAAAKAKLETVKAGYIAQGIQAEVFEQKVKTTGSVVAANRAAASGASSAAEAAGALVEVDEASVAAARAKVEAAQAEVQALKGKEVEAELKAAVYKGEVQKWRATLSAASAEVTANKAELGAVSAQNQALAQQVMAINSEGFTKVAAAQLSVAKAQATGANIKTSAMSAAADIQMNTAENQISLVDARIDYLEASTSASVPMAKNEAIAVVNDAIARSNQAVSTITGDANSGVRQAAQNQATSSTAATDIAFRYNAELAKAFAALNAGKLAGYRISTSQRMTGEMGVRFNMSARKDESYFGSLSQSDDCETITTHEESV